METKDHVLYKHNPKIGMPNSILDNQGNQINEKIEVIVDKTKLQFFGWAVGALLTIISVFLLRVLSGVETLKENSEDFKTYIKTNDQRFLYSEQRFNQHLEEAKKLETRIKSLEDKEAAFWKEHGWRFQQNPK